MVSIVGAAVRRLGGPSHSPSEPFWTAMGSCSRCPECLWWRVGGATYTAHWGACNIYCAATSCSYTTLWARTGFCDRQQIFKIFPCPGPWDSFIGESGFCMASTYPPTELRFSYNLSAALLNPCSMESVPSHSPVAQTSQGPNVWWIECYSTYLRLLTELQCCSLLWSTKAAILYTPTWE